MPQRPNPEPEVRPAPEEANLPEAGAPENEAAANGFPGPSRYQVYGLAFGSDFDFTYPLVRARAPADLCFSCHAEAPAPAALEEQAECVYATRASNGQRSGLYRRAGGEEVLRFLDGKADFHLHPERITCRLRDSSYAHGVEIWLLGTVLAYWLERRGVPMLHASAVTVEGRGAAFLASSRGGKSSLAAALMQRGHALLTDDLLALDVPEAEGPPVGRPGYPQMRMWPDQAAHFTGGYESLARVVPHLDKRRVPVGTPGGLGAFCGTPRPLACLYLPERRAPGEPNTEIDITPVAPRDAVVELVRQSFLPELVAAAGLQAGRMKRLAEVARRVPVRRLVYPDGMAHLPRVQEALREDLRQRSSGGNAV